MNAIMHYLNSLDDYLNPILVKDLRQTVKSRFIWLILAIFLLILIYVLNVSYANMDLRSSTEDTLFKLFFVFVPILTFLVIPLYYAFKFASERYEKTDELLYITTMTPQSIVRGKFLATMTLVLMVYSIALPYVFLSFFFSKMNVLYCFLSIFVALVMTAFSITMLLCIASISMSNASYGSLRVLSFILQIILLGLFFELLKSLALPDIFSRGDTFRVFVAFVLLACYLSYFFYGAAASAISPTGSNKMFWPRTRLAILWALFLIFSIVVESFHNGFEMWAVFSMSINCLLLFVFVSEADEISDRIKKEIPDTAFKKIIYFPFFTGASNGLIWCTAIHLSTCLVLFLVGHAREYVILFSHAFTCFLFYASLGSFIRRKYRETSQSSSNWKYMLALSLIGIFADLLVSVGSSTTSANPFKYLNPLSGMGFHPMNMFSTASLFLFVLALVLNARWLLNQFNEFRNSV